MLHLATAVMEIHLFLLSPLRDFWVNLPPRTAGGYYAENNELLEAWGRPARDLQAMLYRRQAAEVVDQPAARDQPSGDTSLGAVQAEIVGAAAPSAPLDPDDTIQVHVCHSPTREVEVLHDRLLGVFDQYPDIQPADVLVLTPDLDTYAPIIAAVFGAAGRIRFQVGRRRFNEGAAVTAFLGLLDLPGSRYTANAVLAPLRAASVRACFGIGENWHHGLRRLLLGYAIDADADVLLDDVTPCALDRWGFRSGAADYERLGRFLRYYELTFALDDWAQAAHRPDEWAVRLRADVLARFFVEADRGSTPDVSRELSAVAQLIDDFAVECDHAATGEVARLQEALLPYRDHNAAAEVDIAIDGVRAVGTVKRFHGEKNELVRWRIGAIRAKDRIAVWLHLLALTVARDCRLTAYLFGSKNGGEPSRLSGPTPVRARELRGDWVTAWQDGQRRPLPCFAHTSWEWTANRSSSAMASAWAGQPWSEGNDPVHRTIFGDDPVAPACRAGPSRTRCGRVACAPSNWARTALSTARRRRPRTNCCTRSPPTRPNTTPPPGCAAHWRATCSVWT